MFTHKDIEFRSIFVINCIHDRTLRVSNGELLLEEQVEGSDSAKTLTKMPFQKILVLFVVGNIKITTPLIEKCQKFGVALIVVKPSFRPVFFYSNSAEANYLLRKRQYSMSPDNVSIAKVLVRNKIKNQLKALKDSRCKDTLTLNAIEFLESSMEVVNGIIDFQTLLGIEGACAKSYFNAYYQNHNWSMRRPRTKCDTLNATMDIGYTILFNLVECYLRMFGFDLYIGVYHKLWFKRKSLVCDIMEPFRPIIDKAIRTALNRKQFSEKDFIMQKGEWHLKFEKNADYSRIFFDALIPYKTEVFKYIQSYYRCFMGDKPSSQYPTFNM